MGGLVTNAVQAALSPPYPLPLLAKVSQHCWVSSVSSVSAFFVVVVVVVVVVDLLNKSLTRAASNSALVSVYSCIFGAIDKSIYCLIHG